MKGRMVRGREHRINRREGMGKRKDRNGEDGESRKREKQKELRI